MSVSHAHAQPRAAPRRQVLVVDDSRAQRMTVRSALLAWGYDVTEAASGEAGLQLCREQPFDIVLSDWVMPGMSGLDFCRAFRDLPLENHGYFILLTSKSGKKEVALGLDAGADDFLSKPVNPAELRARIRAGERLITAQQELHNKNRLLGVALRELQSLYDSLDRDLIEARKLQQSLVRDNHHDFGTGTVSLLLRPSGHVGGDLVGYVPLGADRLGFFSLDVSGHGVASAMMAARLAGVLTTTSNGGNALLDHQGGTSHPRPPEEVLHLFNQMVLDVMQVEQYFTCVYGDLDRRSGRLRLVQAGHPHPLLLDAGGGVRLIGAGGLPVGLIAGAEWERVTLTLAPGDRLLLMSDGFTECRNRADAELGEDGVIAMVAAIAEHHGTGFLAALETAIRDFAGHGDFADDVSAVLLEWRG